MRAAAALAALLACALLPGAALGYGTTTTYASGSAGTPPGAWAAVSAAGSATDGEAAATLTETDAGGLADTRLPGNREFASDASGWTAVDHGSTLCAVTSGHDPGQGSPPGSLRTSYATLLNLLDLLAACDSSWTSASFTWTGGTPAAVAFSMDRAVDLNGLVGLATASWSAHLVDETVPGSIPLVSGSSNSDAGWATQSATGIGPGDLVPGHTYHLRIEIAFDSLLSLASGFGVNIDDVVLSVTPQDHRAVGELRIAGVPPGTTHTLEVRARTSGEPFDLQVWDGGAWTTRATVSAAAPSWQQVSHGLTAGEWNGGEVRLRALDVAAGPDDTADVLSVDYARVVSTGGITVSGPTSVTLDPVTIDGLSPKVSSGPLGTVEVADAGGAASGWELTAAATAWTLDGDPGESLPADALSVTAAAPTTPDGSDLGGLAAGPGGVLAPGDPVVLLTAAPGAGVGTYRQAPTLALTVPVRARAGVYRSLITLSAS
jgi:hypothetical protein